MFFFLIIIMAGLCYLQYKLVKKSTILAGLLLPVIFSVTYIVLNFDFFHLYVLVFCIILWFLFFWKMINSKK
ncbi:hypothetical protein ABE28_018655 [Peribacillus muralis]|uniref:DUF2651 domain-containing protein n=1 Tax=Peribacillus muralis TaxID=264697 RepID=A0A1B3XT53_9BACI|nr:hypothetical protein ABE28_018655 [Peribacillus muralis]